jgi:hypothetical protein
MVLSLLLATVLAHAFPPSPGSVTFHRRVEVRECYSRRQCSQWRSLGEDPATLPLQAFGKAGLSGFDGWSRQALRVHQTTVKTEIHLVRHATPGPYKYFLYAMIRTGKRHGQTLEWNLHDLNQIQQRALLDKPSGRFQARMIIGR